MSSRIRPWAWRTLIFVLVLVGVLSAVSSRSLLRMTLTKRIHVHENNIKGWYTIHRWRRSDSGSELYHGPYRYRSSVTGFVIEEGLWLDGGEVAARRWDQNGRHISTQGWMPGWVEKSDSFIFSGEPALDWMIEDRDRTLDQASPPTP